MSQEKKNIIKEMGLGALAHVSKINASHSLLRELVASYYDYYGCLKTLHGKIYITPHKVAAALGINHGENHFPEKVDYGRLNAADKEIIDSFKCVTLTSLKKSVLDMSVEGEGNRHKFWRTFVIVVQKCFLLPTTVSMASPIQKLPAFCVDNIRQLPTVNLDSEPLETQMSSTPSVNALANARAPIVVSLPSSLKEELIKDYFTYDPSEFQTQEASINACLPKPKKRAGEESSPRKAEPKPPLKVAACPKQWEDDAHLFSLGTSPSASQPSAPSQSTVSQLEILADTVVDVGVAAALKFANATSVEPSHTTAERYRTPEKEKEITEELMEKRYHWMIHFKETKDSSNKYDTTFVLKHEVNFKGLRHYFMSLMPEQHVESTVVTAHNMILNQIKGHRFQE
ncbi:uncharacterized protein DS421_3g73540 [Arachis hypogaea]|nr:uncharacterized protein DS421_3g73540 [Arachis hypogaea]